MTPNEPGYPVPVSPETPAPAPPTPRWPFWSYRDVFFFVGLIFPSFVIALILVQAVARFIPFGRGFDELLMQLVLYILIFGGLYAIFRLRYEQPFWRSLGWGPPFRWANLSFLGGPLLAFANGYLGYAIRVPEIQNPFQQMLLDRPSIVLFAIFAVIIGPLCEELAFRGFLMPLLVRDLGAGAGVLVTALIFGAIHAPEYQYSWKHAALICLAGVVFGWVRYRTGSTAASTFMHSSYNLTQLAAFLAQSRTI